MPARRLEALLNLVWIMVALTGFATLLWHNRKQGHSWARVRFGQLLAVALVVVSLFPAVSASDDTLRYQFLFGGGGSAVHDRHVDPTPVPDGLLVNLVRLFDSIESFVTTAAAVLSLLLILVARLRLSPSRSWGRALVLRTGRAPPAFA